MTVASIRLDFPVWYLKSQTPNLVPGEFAMDVIFDKATGEHLLPLFQSEEEAKRHAYVKNLPSKPMSLSKSAFVLLSRNLAATKMADGYVIDDIGGETQVLPLDDVCKIRIAEDDRIGENV